MLFIQLFTFQFHTLAYVAKINFKLIDFLLSCYSDEVPNEDSAIVTGECDSPSGTSNSLDHNGNEQITVSHTLPKTEDLLNATCIYNVAQLAVAEAAVEAVQMVHLDNRAVTCNGQISEENIAIKKEVLLQ